MCVNGFGTAGFGNAWACPGTVWVSPGLSVRNKGLPEPTGHNNVVLSLLELLAYLLRHQIMQWHN